MKALLNRNGTSPDTAETAVELARRVGWHVFPCKPGGKAPATPNGFKDASNDPETVRRLFEGRTDYNVGFVPGLSGHVVIDTDSEDGERNLRELLGGEPPATANWTTARGVHRLYGLPEGVTLRDRSGVVPDVDIKSAAGYVLVPPSIHPDGTPYTLRQGSPVARLTPQQVAALSWKDRGEAPPQDGLRAPSIEALRSAVEALPNDERFSSRDEWRDVGYAIKAACGPENEGEGLQLFQEWSARWEGPNDPEYNIRTWDSLNAPYRVGYPLLAELAGVSMAVEEFQVDPNAAPPAEHVRKARKFEGVSLKPVRWVAPGILARTLVTTVAGWGGVGKGFLVIDWISRLSRGESIPGEIDTPAPIRRKPLRVLVLSTEDDAPQLKLRLSAAGADMERVRFIPEGELDAFQLKAPGALKRWVRELEGVDVLFLDPLKGVTAGVNDLSEPEIRAALLTLTMALRQTGAACLATRHFAKRAAGGMKAGTPAVIAASGNASWTNVSRVEFHLHGVVQDGEPTERILATAKNNYSVPPKSQRYKLESVTLSTPEGPAQTARLVHLGESDVSADDLLSGATQAPELDRARRFLCRLLASGPVPSSDVLGQASEKDITERTLKRAKKDVGVESIRKDGQWWWTFRSDELDGGGVDLSDLTPND